jgi:hypothetical protein
MFRAPLAVLAVSAAVVTLAAGPASANDAAACPPATRAVGFSDNLDKLVYDGVTLGGLSSIAWDRRSGAWASTVDNHATDPSRIWFFRDPLHPSVVRDPLVLRRPDGTAYDGTTADNEGLAVLPDGDYVVSSETEPSIRIFGRDGVQKASLPVPARFAVAPTEPGFSAPSGGPGAGSSTAEPGFSAPSGGPGAGSSTAGQATANATLEGLTLVPGGRRIIASMEGALSGDTDPTLHRFLVYDLGRHGTWSLVKQIAYRAQSGLRIPEIAAYGHDSLLVMEAAFDTVNGNSIDLYAVQGVGHARDVSGVPDLATAPARDVLRKSLVADLVKCPTLGAPSREPQANPLLDNYEGMAVVPGRRGADTIELISDDNFGAAQFTRVLTLTANAG